MNHISITGIDKSGKSSVIKALMEKTNYKHYVVDRDPSTYHALNFIQDRIKDIEQVDEYLGFINGFKHSVDLAVLLTCKPYALEKRFKLHNEPPIVGNLSLQEHQQVILTYFNRVEYPKFLIIETSNKTIENCVKLIIDKLGE